MLTIVKSLHFVMCRARFYHKGVMYNIFALVPNFVGGYMSVISRIFPMFDPLVQSRHFIFMHGYKDRYYIITSSDRVESGVKC
jgi:hypothetical protein